jgi:hypothetical protein
VRAAILILLVARAAGAVETHGAEQRVAHLVRLLEAVRATPASSLEHAQEYIRVLDRGQCAAATERLEVECLMTAARRYCQKGGGARCQAIMDVVISNVLADKQLIPSARRYELMKSAKDPRAELKREMRRIQGALAVDLHLHMGGASDDDAEVARHIDRFCRTTADATSLSWQACASSLVWFLRAEAAR